MKCALVLKMKPVGSVELNLMEKCGKAVWECDETMMRFSQVVSKIIIEMYFQTGSPQIAPTTVQYSEFTKAQIFCFWYLKPDNSLLKIDLIIFLFIILSI